LTFLRLRRFSPVVRSNFPLLPGSPPEIATFLSELRFFSCASDHSGSTPFVPVAKSCTAIFLYECGVLVWGPDNLSFSVPSPLSFRLVSLVKPILFPPGLESRFFDCVVLDPFPYPAPPIRTVAFADFGDGGVGTFPSFGGRRHRGFPQITKFFPSGKYHTPQTSPFILQLIFAARFL